MARHKTKPALWELTVEAQAHLSNVAFIALICCNGANLGFQARIRGAVGVDLHIVVNGQLSVREGHRLAHKVEAEVLKALPQLSEVLVHVEPEEELAVEGQKDGRR